MNARLPLERTLTIASYLDFDPEPDLNTAAPPVGAPEGNYKGSVVNNTFRYVMAALRSLGDAVPKLGAGMAASTTIGTLATKSTVTATELSASAVTTAKIADGAVTEAKLAAASVTTDKIAAGAVTTDRLATFAVTGLRMAQGAVGEDKLADGSVSTAKIQTLAVITSRLANLSVTNAKIDEGAVGPGKLNAGVTSAIAKAWVAFNDAGAIHDSFNVSSVIRNGAGDYTINWATDFGNSSYAVIATVLVDATVLPRIAHVRSRAAGNARVIVTGGEGNLIQTGVTGVHVVAFGEQ